MSKAQKGNKEKKKPKADKNQPKTHVSAYKAAQDQAKPSFNPFFDLLAPYSGAL